MVNLHQIASEYWEWEARKHRHGESLGGIGMPIAAGDAKVMLD